MRFLLKPGDKESVADRSIQSRAKRSPRDRKRRDDRKDDGRNDDKDRDQEWPRPKDVPPERILEDYPIPPQRHRRGKERYTPYLVLRYAAGDTGARPLPPGTTFWHSPDVWVIGSAGYNVPVAGEENRIFARVNNWGMKDQAGVIVRYWWCNPSLGITEANAHLIGQTSAFVPSGYSVVVECPVKWVPVIENGGHECVLAEAFAPYWDPLVAPLEPVTDRHVCQKNLHLVELAAGEPFQFSLSLVNPTAEARRVRVLLQSLPFERVQTALRSPDIGYRKDLTRTRRALPIQMALSEKRDYLAAPTATYPLRLLGSAVPAEAGAGLDYGPSGPTAMTLVLEAWESRSLLIKGQAPSDARTGEAFGLEFREQLGGLIIGGYTLYAVIGDKK